MMGRFRGILAAGDRTLLDRVEGRITYQPWDAMPWSGYVVVPREQLAEVLGTEALRLDLEGGMSLAIHPDPAAAGPAPVVVAFRGTSVPLGVAAGAGV